jgi:hypothetical protein
MQHAPPFRQLGAAWAKQTGAKVPPVFFDFVPLWIESALGDREVQYADEIEVEGDP